MKYKTRTILSNKHHVSSALYHLERVMPSVSETDHNVIGKEILNTIREQLKLWERDLYLLSQED